MNHNERQRELDQIDGNTFAWIQETERAKQEYEKLTDEPTQDEINLDPFEGEQ